MNRGLFFWILVLSLVSPLANAETTSSERAKLHVLPLAFSSESKKNYGEWIKKLQAQGFGNAVWLEVEAILQDSTNYELIMAPDQADDFRDLLQSIIEEQTEANASDPLYEKPEYLIQINSNFFVNQKEELKGFRSIETTIFHVTIYLRHYELKLGKLNVAKTAIGSSKGEDPISAAREASRLALEKLLSELATAE